MHVVGVTRGRGEERASEGGGGGWSRKCSIIYQNRKNKIKIKQQTF